MSSSGFQKAGPKYDHDHLWIDPGLGGGWGLGVSGCGWGDWGWVGVVDDQTKNQTQVLYTGRWLTTHSHETVADYKIKKPRDIIMLAWGWRTRMHE